MPLTLMCVHVVDGSAHRCVDYTRTAPNVSVFQCILRVYPSVYVLSPVLDSFCHVLVKSRRLSVTFSTWVVCFASSVLHSSYLRFLFRVPSFFFSFSFLCRPLHLDEWRRRRFKVCWSLGGLSRRSPFPVSAFIR